MMKYLSICATLAAVSGCCSTAPYTTIPEPTCDVPFPVTQEVWNDLRKLREVMSHNALVDQDCIERYRERIRIHNESG